MATPKTHILVIRLSAMGDVAMCIPVLRALLQQYPELEITVLTRAFFKPFFRDLKNTVVFVADVKAAHKGVSGLYKLAKHLNKHYKFDAVADLHNVLRSKILRALVNAPQVAVIDKGRQEKKQLVAGQLFKQLKTTHQRYADVFNALGYPVNLKTTYTTKISILTDNTKLLLEGKPLGNCIGIAPFAAHKGKMYPLSLMEKVILELSKTHTIILFGGGKKEIALLDAIAHKNPNVVSTAGKLSLEEELDIISHLQLMIAMDSGNSHIAAMLGIKVLTIWGVTHPYAGFAPFQQPENSMLLASREAYPEIPTSIYGNKYPEGYEEASGSVLPETVIKKVQELL